VIHGFKTDTGPAVATILAALTNYDFEEATPLLATLVLRRAGKRPPPAYFALIDDLGMLVSYDDGTRSPPPVRVEAGW
jgi:hypothetical protein